MSASSQPELAESQVETAKPTTRGLRIAEFVLVLFVAFASPILNSTWVLATGSEPLLRFTRFGLLSQVLHEIAGIALLAYVLFRRGQGIKDLGLTLRWSDLPHSVVLAAGTIAIGRVGYGLLMVAHSLLIGRTVEVKHLGITVGAGASLLSVVFIFLNPVFEEAIARAYVISELLALRCGPALAVAFSVALQTSYHLYQGGPAALHLAIVFTVVSVYYVKTHRLAPVILVHFYFDSIALLSAAHTSR